MTAACFCHLAVFGNKGKWDKTDIKIATTQCIDCIVTQCNLFENAEKLPEETTRQVWSGMTEFSLLPGEGDNKDDRAGDGVNYVMPSRPSL